MAKKIIKNPLIYIAVAIILIITARHIKNSANTFYTPSWDYCETGVGSSAEDIFKYTGLSYAAAKEMMQNQRQKDIELLNKMYFEKPGIKKQYILFPITAEEKITSTPPPLAPLKKGDILVSFSTHTLDWRHGHIALVLTDGGEFMLEHISMGKKSVITKGKKWNKYANFVVLRHYDKETADAAANYALAKLEGVPYSILAGLNSKDKSAMEDIDTSHCSHIVWQAYKALGTDLDSNKGKVVTPHDIAMSDELKIVQIYGVNPKEYKDRVLTQ